MGEGSCWVSSVAAAAAGAALESPAVCVATVRAASGHGLCVLLPGSLCCTACMQSWAVVVPVCLSAALADWRTCGSLCRLQCCCVRSWVLLWMWGSACPWQQSQTPGGRRQQLPSLRRPLGRPRRGSGMGGPLLGSKHSSKGRQITSSGGWVGPGVHLCGPQGRRAGGSGLWRGRGFLLAGDIC